METYVSSQDQIIDHAHDLSHCSLQSPFALIWARKLNALPISQQSSRQQLVIDVQRRCTEVVGLHCLYIDVILGFQ
jgi:hypothetical protein